MPLTAVQIAADFLLFGQMPVSIYELPSWLAEELREVMRIYYANHKEEG